MSLIKKQLKALRMQALNLICFRCKFIGADSYCGKGVHIRRGTAVIGSESFIGVNSRLAVDCLTVGNFVMLAANVAAIGGDHDYSVVGTPMIRATRPTSKSIVIEDDVWVGHGAIILHGVTIGEGAIIGANTIVTKDVPPYSIFVGNPGRLIRFRFDRSQIEDHRNSLQQIRSTKGYATIEKLISMHI